MQKFLESKHLEPKSAELHYVPTTTKELNEAQQDEVFKLLDMLEADDDVQQVIITWRRTIPLFFDRQFIFDHPVAVLLDYCFDKIFHRGNHLRLFSVQV